MPRGATCSPISKGTTIGSGATRRSATSPPTRQKHNLRNPVSTFSGQGHYTVTNAAAHDGGQLGAVLDRDNTASDVWADTAYRSVANLTLLERRGLRPRYQR